MRIVETVGRPSQIRPLQSKGRRGSIHRRMWAARGAIFMVCAMGGSSASIAASEMPTPVPHETVAEMSPAVAAAQQLAALPNGGDGASAAQEYIAAMPMEVIEALGYTPVIVDGLPSDPEGGCSSPMPLPDSFTPACLTHDLGYDFLRVADASNEQIPSGVRFALDQQLGTRMSASCGGGVVEQASCKARAEIADLAVKANTWRQGEGAPVEENWPWA